MNVDRKSAPPPDPAAAGRNAKARGINGALGNPRAATWRLFARLVVRQLADERRPFTSEDVTSLVGQPPTTPNLVGAIINEAARQGWIVRIDHESATRINQHAALIGVWMGLPEQIPMLRLPRRQMTLRLFGPDD